ncbi:MAG TPA: hypothetical protein VF167_07170 [Longimicrobiaceae bacterium]
MNWLRRWERVEAPVGAPAPPVAGSARVERQTRGISTLLAGVSRERMHSVLDLGGATNSSLQVYRGFARWVRFEDLLSVADSEEELDAALASIPHHRERPYDVLLAWNLLDRVAPHQRPRVVARLAEVSAPDARLFLAIEAGSERPQHPLRFGLVDNEHMWFEPVEGFPPAWPPLLPAELERLIEPFVVSRAFTTRVGFREYVATKRG